MIAYTNLHFALEKQRGMASESPTVQGPRVMVIGPENAGKTSLVKILTAYDNGRRGGVCEYSYQRTEPCACEITVGVLLRFENAGREYKIIQSTSVQNGSCHILKTFRGQREYPSSPSPLYE